MSNLNTQNPDINKIRLNRYGVRGIVREIFLSLLNLVVLLISAGKIGWINAWVCIGLILSHKLVNTIVLFKLNPQLLNKRGKLVQEGTKFFDKVFIAFYVTFALMISVVAGLDVVRYEWSHMSFGVVIYILACILVSWAMAVNPHFEMTVLIQDNGEHQVCTAGPYKVVRHPGYAAAIIGAFSYPLILGSWWGLVAVLPLNLLFVIRTALEDRTLQRELPGYKEYTNITRYRLVPFVW